MKRWRQPTLVKRMMLGLISVFFLVWCVLIGFSYWNVMRGLEKSTYNFGNYASEYLESIEDVRQARMFAQGIFEIQSRQLKDEKDPFAIGVQLWSKEGQVVFSSPEFDDLRLHDIAVGVGTVQVRGQAFQSVRTDLERWNLVLFTSAVDLRWAIQEIAISLLPPMGIAFCLVSVVLWMVVRRGLRPLDLLSAHIAARSPDDLQPTGVVAHYAELRPLQEALDDMLKKLRHKVSRETAFVQEAAHELRTPMAVVSAQAHVLRKAQDPLERLDAEKHLDDALARASHLVEQLLQLAYVGSESQLVLLRLDVVREVAADLATLAPMALARHIELGLDAPDQLMMDTERQTFKSILLNLVGNAIRYVPAGGKVDVSMALDGADMVLVVADNGAGIAPEQRGLVFDRFHRAGDHEAPGAGLGLSIVLQACRRLGGQVHLRDVPAGQGCQFEVRLPLKARGA
ncbi:MAG: HAMP domain-containing sensor histidine kinase [Rhodoferax sp.]|nr:HAMP domain-containing sensor histidine kinase [Rhodoferax sp.]